jgi:antitoxin component of MazEF toxin-antitoxin module
MIRRIHPQKRRLAHKDRLPQTPAYTLEQLVRAITEENRHSETDWGPPVGNEVW